MTTEDPGLRRRGALALLGLMWLGAMSWQARKAMLSAPSLMAALPSNPYDIDYSVFEGDKPAGTLQYTYTPDPSSEEALVALDGEVLAAGIVYRLDLSAKLSSAAELESLTFIVKAEMDGFPLTGILDGGMLELTSAGAAGGVALPLPPGLGRAFLFPLLPLETVPSGEYPLDLAGLAPSVSLLVDERGVLSGVSLPGGWRVSRRDPGG